ncbi:MAG TPA: hypothetical protein VIF82_06305 [Burkholderiaceae bacterium]|jgi:S-adenosylmethionine hydrolase
MTKKKTNSTTARHNIWSGNIIGAPDESGDVILVLPDELCDQLNLKIGDTFDVSVGKSKKIILKKIDS